MNETFDMLRFNQILRRLPKIKKELARFVKIYSPRMGFQKNGMPFYLARTSSTMIYDAKKKQYKVNPNANQRYLTQISVLDKAGHVKLSCSCPDFLFRHEVALFTKEAADIEYSNGDYPIETNPLLSPTCCKHCLAFYQLLHNRGLVK